MRMRPKPDLSPRLRSHALASCVAPKLLSRPCLNYNPTPNPNHDPNSFPDRIIPIPTHQEHQTQMTTEEYAIWERLQIQAGVGLRIGLGLRVRVTVRVMAWAWGLD